MSTSSSQAATATSAGTISSSSATASIITNSDSNTDQIASRQWISSFEWSYRMKIGFLGVLMCMFTLFLCIQDEIKTAYMDEQFHVDQLQAYCAGNFSYYNSALTTPPGLYLFTIGVFKPFKELYAFGKVSANEICPLYLARFTNFIFGIANFFLVYLIQIKLNAKYLSADRYRIFISSLATASLPPLFFFNFLYYTDPGSLFFVLLMYLFDLENHKYLAALFGLLSLLFRQTNIVWIFFVAAKYSLNLILKLKKCNLSNRDVFTHALIDIVRKCAGYLIVAFIFLIFVFINNGIVLGDRDAHRAVLHTGQLHYYLAFVALFAWPHLLVELLNSLERIIFNTKFLLKFIIITLALLCLSNYAHPYLLADNRHYTFYAWRRVFNANYSYMLMPFYALTLLLMYEKMNHLDKLSRNVFIAFHFFSTLLTIVPAHLLEFRYFIIPYIIWRLHLRLHSTALQLELATNLIINLATFYVFISKTFYWPHNSNDPQRLMW